MKHKKTSDSTTMLTTNPSTLELVESSSNLECETNGVRNTALELGPDVNPPVKDIRQGQENEEDTSDIIYKIDDRPPIGMSAILGLQHYLTMFGSTLSMPFLIAPAMCMEDNDPAKGYLISTIFFVSGMVTILQSTFGCRLPIIQGTSFSFLVPTFAILNLDKFKCPSTFDPVMGWSVANMTYEEKTEEWQFRMREIQGAIACSAVAQIILGYFGLFGLILKFITPLTIAPCVTMIGISLFNAANANASKNWGVSAGTILAMILFSQYLKDIKAPMFIYKRGKGWQRKTVEIFKLFPVLMTIAFMWVLCAILTAASNANPDNPVLEPGDPARTDNKLRLLYESSWFRFPYPFQWGVPTVSLAGVFGMLAGTLAGAIESVGDYYACARLSGASMPPMHAINRGLGTEGIGCLLAGLWGTGNGTTSYSENIGAIGVTKVASRMVIQVAGVIMILLGLFAKFGAFFLTIPDPIVGGIFYIMFGMIAAVGLSNLQYVSLNSSRNLFVLGFSIFFGLAFPTWLTDSNTDFDVGEPIISKILTVLCKTNMFMAGLVGCILDNTIPGTEQERGLAKWRAHLQEHSDTEEGSSTAATYDFPCGMNFIRRFKWFSYVPFSPTFTGFEFLTEPLGKMCPFRRCRGKEVDGEAAP